MRPALFLIAASLAATPAVAQQAAPADAFQVPPELTDPKMVARLTNVMQALSKAMLNLPVGEIAAAAEGRAATAAERATTVRDLGRRDDPNFERKLERQIAQSGPAMQSAMQALASALPAMMKGMSEAREELERATANMPQPGYPKR